MNRFFGFLFALGAMTTLVTDRFHILPNVESILPSTTTETSPPTKPTLPGYHGDPTNYPHVGKPRPSPPTDDIVNRPGDRKHCYQTGGDWKDAETARIAIDKFCHLMRRNAAVPSDTGLSRCYNSSKKGYYCFFKVKNESGGDQTYTPGLCQEHLEWYLYNCPAGGAGRLDGSAWFFRGDPGENCPTECEKDPDCMEFVRDD